MNSLALDIGGANIKAIYGRAGDEHCQTTSVPFELWREPGLLGEHLRGLSQRFGPFERLLITMTAAASGGMTPPNVWMVRTIVSPTSFPEAFITTAWKAGFPSRPVTRCRCLP